jgi:hypothetical protein
MREGWGILGFRVPREHSLQQFAIAGKRGTRRKQGFPGDAFGAPRRRGIQFATKISGREILCNGAPLKIEASAKASRLPDHLKRRNS